MLNSSLEVYAGLRCRVIDGLAAGQHPAKLVVFCHGFGAPGDDLVAFGPHLIEASDNIASRCRFVFPEAPIDLTPVGMPGGRAWWQINMAELARVNETKAYDELTKLAPPGMSEATEQRRLAVQEAQEASGLADDSTVLGGFSQGAMISTNLVLEHDLTPELLVIFSGTLLNSERWQSKAAAHPGCPVIQSHGRIDPVLPFEPAETLRDVLAASGFDVSFHAFHGPHTIPMELMAEVASRLEH